MKSGSFKKGKWDFYHFSEGQNTLFRPKKKGELELATRPVHFWQKF